MHWRRYILAIGLSLGLRLEAQVQVRIGLVDADPPYFKVDGSAILPKINNPNFSAIFKVSVVTATGASLDPIGGDYEVKGNALFFKPRYKLEPGVFYRAVFKLANEAGAADLTLPKPQVVATTVVERIYPSTSMLPENQLKFYIHFSAPMSRGEAAKRIHLLEDGSAEVKLPFLEIDEELWDRDQRRLTLLFDPGRIKTDVLPNREVGMALKAGKKYVLVVDAEWKDASNNPLKGAFRKEFEAGPADRTPIDPKLWNVAAPPAGTTDPLVVNLPEPLDAALLRSFIDVNDATGNLVRGRSQLGQAEKSWLFTPEKPWQAGRYTLEILKTIEDLAGNKIGRAFEVDRADAPTVDSTSTYSLPFTVEAKAAQ